VGAAKRRRNLRTGRTYEVEHCYSRSVRVGDVVYVSGSTSVNLKEVVDWPYDAYHQALQTLGVICHTVAAQGLPFRDVVRTRCYVVGEENLAAVARALREIFGGVCPAATVVGVPVLGRPEIMVEIEATAVAGHGG
jgi:enamine deaminase RidA (YjgF/YER057c/UK114 family)